VYTGARQVDVGAGRGDCEVFLGQNIGGKHLLDELIQRCYRRVQCGEHLLGRLGRGANVTTGESVEGLEEIAGMRVAMVSYRAGINRPS
jgi:hypothetical protein